MMVTMSLPDWVLAERKPGMAGLASGGHPSLGRTCYPPH